MGVLPCGLGSNPPVQITAMSAPRVMKIAEVSVKLKIDLLLFTGVRVPFSFFSMQKIESPGRNILTAPLLCYMLSTLASFRELCDDQDDDCLR